MRAAVLPPGTLTSDERVEIHVRLLPLLIRLDLAQRALELVELLNGAASDPRLAPLHLQLVMLTAQFEDPIVKDASLRDRVDAFIASVDANPIGAERIAKYLEPLLEDEPGLHLEYLAAYTRLEARLENDDDDDTSP
jgi:hypothetical protein